MHQIAQEGALWSSVMITLGPCWRKVKLNIGPILPISSDNINNN